MFIKNKNYEEKTHKNDIYAFLDNYLCIHDRCMFY